MPGRFSEVSEKTYLHGKLQGKAKNLFENGGRWTGGTDMHPIYKQTNIVNVG